jgi:hypothetical protein
MSERSALGIDQFMTGHVGLSLLSPSSLLEGIR